MVFLVWLWHARENSQVLAPQYRHRLAKGWTIGSWFCPVVQFWFPLTIVDDIDRASTPPQQPGMIAPQRGRGVILGWWAAWVLYWVMIWASIPLILVTIINWAVNLADAEEAGNPIDELVIQADIVEFVRWLSIGFAASSVLTVIAGVLVCLVIWRITTAQDARAAAGPVAPSYGPPYQQPPQQLAPRQPNHPGYPGQYGQQYPTQPGQPAQPGQAGQPMPIQPWNTPQYPEYGRGRPQEPPQS